MICNSTVLKTVLTSEWFMFDETVMVRFPSPAWSNSSLSEGEGEVSVILFKRQILIVNGFHAVALDCIGVFAVFFFFLNIPGNAL